MGNYFLKTAALALLLAPWYFFTNGPNPQKPIDERYSLPEKIEVVETTTPYHLEEAGDGDGSLEKFVYTDEIDFR